MGKELSQILYSKNARIYMAARSQEKTLAAISEIKSSLPSSTGDLIFLPLDLADLTTIASSARQFLDREPKLHVLFNNAGVMNPPKGSATKQGYELQLGVNNIGTFLFTKLLSQRLVETAAATAAEEPGTVRVIWVSSSAAEAPLVARGGVDMKDIGQRLDKAEFTSYALSKAGNYLHAVEMAKRFRDKGVLSIALNPGNLDSELWRTQTAFMSRVLKTFVLHPPKFGAYTELFAGLSPAVTLDRSGDWGKFSFLFLCFVTGYHLPWSRPHANTVEPVGPWGRFLTIRGDLKKAAEDGTSEAFWDWTEKQVQQYETPTN